MKLFSAALLLVAAANAVDIEAKAEQEGHPIDNLHPEVVAHLQSEGVHPADIHPEQLQQIVDAHARARIDPNAPVHQRDHYKLNDHYDNSDEQHHHYGSDKPASPAYPNAPEFSKAVNAFDSYGTLFGEHRYQL